MFENESEPHAWSAQNLCFIRIEREVGYVCVQPDHLSSIDAAVENYISSGRTRDSLLRLELVSGDSLFLPASEILSFVVSTPSGRDRSAQFFDSLRTEVETRGEHRPPEDWE